MRPPSMSLLRTFSPRWQTSTSNWTAARETLANPRQQSHAQFSTTPVCAARNKGRTPPDPRITQLRYHLSHPNVPRPLRFSRHRTLRHWTIHRAWTLYQSQRRMRHERELEQQYTSMSSACEALRNIDGLGRTAEDRQRLGVDLSAEESAGHKDDMGRLYRTAMMKTNVYQGMPIEYARIQTDAPSREGWNHGWKR